MMGKEKGGEGDSNADDADDNRRSGAKANVKDGGGRERGGEGGDPQSFPPSFLLAPSIPYSPSMQAAKGEGGEGGMMSDGVGGGVFASIVVILRTKLFR